MDIDHKGHKKVTNIFFFQFLHATIISELRTRFCRAKHRPSSSKFHTVWNIINILTIRLWPQFATLFVKFAAISCYLLLTVKFPDFPGFPRLTKAIDGHIRDERLCWWRKSNAVRQFGVCRVLLILLFVTNHEIFYSTSSIAIMGLFDTKLWHFQNRQVVQLSLSCKIRFLAMGKVVYLPQQTPLRLR